MEEEKAEEKEKEKDTENKNKGMRIKRPGSTYLSCARLITRVHKCSLKGGEDDPRRSRLPGSGTHVLLDELNVPPRDAAHHARPVHAEPPAGVDRQRRGHRGDTGVKDLWVEVG